MNLYIDYFCSYRSSGTDFYLIFLPFLHFLIRQCPCFYLRRGLWLQTDMFEAIKIQEGRCKGIRRLCVHLFVEHDAAGARAQLKTLWVEHVRDQLLEDDGAPLDSGAGEGRLESSRSVHN